MPDTLQKEPTAEQAPAMAPPSGLPQKKSPKLRSSCDACQLAKIRCSQHKPRCQRCVNQDIVCVYSLSRRMGRPRRPTNASLGGQEDSGTIKAQTPIAITLQAGTLSNNTEDQTRQSQSLSDTSRSGTDVVMEDPEPLLDFDTDVQNLNGSKHAHLQIVSSLMPEFDPTAIIGSTDHNDLLASPSNIFDHAPTTTTPPEDFFLMETSSPTFDYQNLVDYLDNSKFTNQRDSDPGGETDTSSGQQHKSITTGTTNKESLDILNFIAPLHHDLFARERTPGLERAQQRNSMTIDIPTGGDEAIISSSWESFTNGYFPSPTQSQMPSVPVTHTSGTSSTSTFDLAGGDSRSSTSSTVAHHRKCGCHTNLLQKLSVLEEYGTEYSMPTIDHILSFEEDTRLLIAQILRCSVCLNQRNSLLLLLTVIVDKIVTMLERVTNGKAKGQRGGASSSVTKPNSSRAASRLKKFAPCGDLNSFTNACPLMVGVYKVSDEETNRFLKRFLQTRLYGMSSLLNQMHQSLQQSQQGGVTRAGSLITMDLQRRLQSVTGRIELWD